MKSVGKRSESVKNRFYGKTWIFRAQAFLYGFFGFFGILMGPAFLLKWIEPNNGKDGTSPGIGLMVGATFFLMAFSLATFNLLARRKPTVRICREGLEIRIIGRTSLDEKLFIPGLIKFFWSFFSGQGFRIEQFRIAWGQLIQVIIQGLPMMKSIAFTGTVERGGWGELAPVFKNGHETIALADWQFKDTLQSLELAVRTFASDHSKQLTLESWTNAR
jgi:hypothetical protein